MALQHFYSRVPAKMSLYNKTDGYDTFAHSEGLEREVIEKDIAVIYENKPTQANAVLIRDGKLPPVYCQYTTNDGTLIQSCVSYLPNDYTGERHAYLVHSLVLGDEEKKQIAESPDNLSLNKDMFKHTIDEFDLTSFDSKPITDYEEIEYKPISDKSAIKLTEKYDQGMLKRLIYALINVSCGKLKSVFITLPDPLDTFSESSLEFINAILRIFPYHIRKTLPFVTYVGDATKFNSFKVKCLPPEIQAPVTTKGVTLRFKTKEAIGISDESVAVSKVLVDFFYGLINNDAVRREFLAFCDHAVKANPTLETPKPKNITDLVFLFRVCSGLFDEKAVLPGDTTLYEFVATYDKYRTAMTDDYRAEALKCLWRYPKSKTAIPKNVFSKLVKIYKTETKASKRTIMNVVLDLIHTDAMRDKIFTFISNNYDDEDADMKVSIMNNLCRVYYGGFLQPQLIEFFDAHFENEPEEICDLIVEKLLLTIRTQNIQNSIIEFMNKHYSKLSKLQKERFYSTFYDMLPECDNLSLVMAQSVNEHIADESDSFKTEVAEKICALVEKDQKRKEPKLLLLLVNTSGFCTDVVIKQVFTEWSGRKVFTSFVHALFEAPTDKCVDNIISVWKTAPDMDADTSKKFIDDCKAWFDNDENKMGLFDLITFEERLNCELTDKKAKAFAEELTDSCIHKAILKVIPEAFNVKKNENGIQVIKEYASKNDYLKNAEEFEPVKKFDDILKAIDNHNAKEFIEKALSYSGKALKKGVADNLQIYVTNNEKFKAADFADMKMLALSLIKYLQTGKGEIADIYDKCLDAVLSDIAENGNAKEEEKKFFSTFVNISQILFESDTHSAFFEDSSDVKSVVSAFVSKYEKDGKKYAKELISKLSNSEFSAYLSTACDVAGGKKGGGLFSKLFGKK